MRSSKWIWAGRRRYSVKCTHRSTMTLSFPEGVFDELMEQYGGPQLRYWAKHTLIREAIRTGLIDRSCGRALLKAGFGIKPSLPAEGTHPLDDAA